MKTKIIILIITIFIKKKMINNVDHFQSLSLNKFSSSVITL